MSEIERQVDAARINRLFAEPSIWRPLPGATGPLDMTRVVANPANHVLMSGIGGMIFEHKMPGIYEIHTAVLPEHRGSAAVGMAQTMVHWLFTRTDAMEVFTRVPHGNLPAATLTRLMGAQRRFTVKQPFPHDIYSGTLQDWLEIAPGLESAGEWFHETLAAQYRDLGMSDVAHAHNAHHNRHVGAAVEMFRAGLPGKGVTVYNRWAAMARAPEISVIGLAPLTIDIRDCVLIVEHGEFRVCRPH